MVSTRVTTRIVGVLFITQLVTAAISYSVLLDPILYGSDFLVNVSENSTKVKVAMFLDLLCGAALVGIATFLYPVLREYSERIALWYVGLRVIEFTTIIVSGILLLTVVSVSQEYVQAAVPESHLLSLGKTFLSARGWTQNMSLIVFSFSSSLFYFLLFTSKLLPRFISVWGLIGVTLIFAEIVLNTFGHGYGLMIMMPMGLNEIFLGMWLIVKGFSPGPVTHSKI